MTTTTHSDPVERYALLLRILHWLMAAGWAELTHVWLAYGILALAVVKHNVVDRNNLLPRISLKK